MTPRDVSDERGKEFDVTLRPKPTQGPVPEGLQAHA